MTDNFYDLSYDHINDLLYASITDYFSYGKINIYDHNNDLLYDFNCGISPGTIVFDIRKVTSINEHYSNKLQEHKLIYDLSGRIINNSSSRRHTSGH